MKKTIKQAQSLCSWFDIISNVFEGDPERKWFLFELRDEVLTKDINFDLPESRDLHEWVNANLSACLELLAAKKVFKSETASRGYTNMGIALLPEKRFWLAPKAKKLRTLGPLRKFLFFLRVVIPKTMGDRWKRFQAIVATIGTFMILLRIGLQWETTQALVVSLVMGLFAALFTS